MISMELLRDARCVLSPVINLTPMIPAKGFVPDCRFYLKADCLQKTGAFKLRGAYYKLSTLTDEEKARGVIACSAGNHAQGVAFAARDMGIPATICIPAGAPLSKIEATRSYGANVVLVPGVYDDAHAEAVRLRDEQGLTFIHPFDDERVMAGQGTIGLEIAEQLGWKMPDYLAISVGDGCTIAGVWKGLKDLYAIGFIDKLPRLISAQAEGCHPINRAIAENKPWEPMEENTLADSIAVGVPRNADKALMAIRESNGIVVNVTDEEIMAAQKLLGTTCGVFGEPAGVTGTAGVKKLCEQGVLGANDTAVSVVTGNGLKDVANAIKFCGEPMSLPNDLDLLVEEFDKRGISVE